MDITLKQSRKPLIPLSIIKDIRCGVCHKFVSCGPVTIEGNENVCCGRCNIGTHDKGLPQDRRYRNFAFEILAGIFLFPCSNWEKNCNWQLDWTYSTDHEENCPYESCCSRFWRLGFCCSRRREIPIGDITRIEVPENLLSWIRCTMCNGFLNCEPVFLLPDGLNLCHRCSIANGVSPEARKNIAFEQISRILVFPCNFVENGCKERMKFGRDLWEHESKCSFKTFLRHAVKKTSQKERGVIETHSGHFYGTLTPNSMLFAPPTANKEYYINQNIVKSLKKHQERKIVKADQLQSQMNEAYSAESSYGDDSRSITPPKEDDDSRQQMQFNRNSGYQTDINQKLDPFYQNILPRVNDSFHKTPKYIPSPDYDTEISRIPSRTSQYSQERTTATHQGSGNRNEQHGDNSYNSYHMSDNGSEKNIVHKQFPEGNMKEIDPLAYNPSFRALNRTESTRSNQELIKELKVKLRKSNSIRNDRESPYVQCKNLGEVLVAHDNIAV